MSSKSAMPVYQRAVAYVIIALVVLSWLSLASVLLS